MNNKLGVVFIYGAGLGSYIWDDLKPKIDYPVLTVDFPNRNVSDNTNAGLTLDDYTNPILKQIENWNKDQIILVTHSIGGVIGLKVAKYFGKKIAGFVGISSAIPLEGNSFVSCLPFPQNIIMPFMLKFLGTKPPKKAIENSLCNGLTIEQKELVVNSFTPESKLLYTEKCNAENPDTKRLFIKLGNDRGFSLSMQNRMANNLKAQKIITIQSGHLPMLSHPKELASVLNDFCNSIY